MILKKENYETLREVSQFSVEEYYAGLNTLLYNEPNFRAFVERKYRLKAYKEEGEFYMTANERFFHTIGFIDAVIWLLERSGYILQDNPYVCKTFQDNGVGAPVWKMLNGLANIVECGDDE